MCWRWCSMPADWLLLVRPDGTNAVTVGDPGTVTKALYQTQFTDTLMKLDGMAAKDSVGVLRQRSQVLGTVKSPDWTRATAGDAGYVLSLLADQAAAYPDATWNLVEKDVVKVGR